jgi:polyisoprenoid-binding protein YceI
MMIRLLATATVAVLGAVLAAPVATRTATPVYAATPVAMTTFTIDPVHSTVSFKVRHLGLSTVRGRFGKFTGNFQLDPASGQVAAATLKIETASVNTDNERRDGHLRSADFFAADSFPEISFVSSRVTKQAGTTYRVEGMLTMRGVTKPVTLTAELAGTRQTPQGWLAAVNLTGTVKRKEYGLMWDRITEGVSAVGDDIALEIGVEAKSAAP